MPSQATYAMLRAGQAESAMLVDALHLLGIRDGRALDLGAGPLNDTRFLLRAGFTVDAVDWDWHSFSLASALNDARLNFIHADMRNVLFTADSYALVVAINVLPFLPRADLPRIVSSITDALSEGGVLCCSVLGLDDSWAQQKPWMTFFSRAEFHDLFSQLRPIVASERKYDAMDALGEPKRWHIMRCLFRK
jgi:SAM-dependent methyltransferase